MPERFSQHYFARHYFGTSSGANNTFRFGAEPTWVFDETNYFTRTGKLCTCPIHTTCPMHPQPRTVHAERVGPPELTDGVVRPSHVLWTWPLVLSKLTPLEQYIVADHQPTYYQDSGSRQQICPVDDDFWPCRIIKPVLKALGITERDIDYRPEDHRDAPTLVQGARLRPAQAPEQGPL